MRRFRTLAGAALLLCACAANPAAATGTCATRAGLEAFLAREAPAAVVRVFPQTDARLLLAAIAAATRTPVPEADELLLVALSANAPVVKVVLIRGGCVSRIGTFERRTITRALNQLSKTGA